VDFGGSHGIVELLISDKYHFEQLGSLTCHFHCLGLRPTGLQEIMPSNYFEKLRCMDLFKWILESDASLFLVCQCALD
jgi:hypothetical protein